MSAIMNSYAIKIDGRFEWLVRKGDLVLSTEKRMVQSKYFSVPLRSATLRKYELALYRYLNREEDDDNVPIHWEDGQYGSLQLVFKAKLI